MPRLSSIARRALPAMLALLAFLPGAVAGGEAPASAWDRNDQAAVRLVAAVTGVGQAATLPAGLQMTLQPGWKTYWRSPGDAGFPVTVDWSGSRNLKAATLSWPVPHRFALFGLETFGYGGEVVLPIAVAPQRPGEPVALRAAVDYLVCEKICVPRHAALALDLPAGPAAPSDFVQLIDRFRHQVPDDGSGHGLSLAAVGIGGGATPSLEVEARSTLPFGHPDLIVEGPAGLHFGPPAVALAEGGRAARLSLPVTRDDGAPPLAAAPLVLTLVDGERGLERAVRPVGPLAAAVPAAAADAGPASAAAGPPRLLAMLLVGLLGGLILNLMPCVLPVLSLKLLGIVGHGGREERAVRAAFLASAAGVLVSFLALAGLLIALRAGGVAIGWGIQFQQPLFLAAMVVLLTLFACNMLGWFEVPLPGWIGDLAGLVPGRPGHHHGLLGNFLTGALATLLATPCSAPFLGTAIGFALAGSAGDILAVFTAIAAGLALPYLAVAAWPGFATRLPRPGRWMVWLRALLGLLLAGTALWLLTVLLSEVGAPAALLVALLMVALALLLWGHRRLPSRLGPAVAGVVGLLAAGALAAPALLAAPGAAPRVAAEALWQPFAPERIPALVADGKLVFVDVTADWCITCQVNKKLVLDDPAVRQRLAGGGAVAMRADWTRPSAAIARYIAGFGRYGIPFNAVYGPRAPQGVPLPELLTRAAVEAGFHEAGG